MKLPSFPMTMECILAPKEILPRFPWLWAFRRHWATGGCCQSGALFALTRDFLTSRIEKHDFETFMLFIENGGLVEAREEPAQRFVGTTIAQALNIIMLDGSSNVQDQRLVQFAIKGSGPVDRTEYYYLFDAGHGGNFWPLIQECVTDEQYLNELKRAIPSGQASPL